MLSALYEIDIEEWYSWELEFTAYRVPAAESDVCEPLSETDILNMPAERRHKEDVTDDEVQDLIDLLGELHL